MRQDSNHDLLAAQLLCRLLDTQTLVKIFNNQPFFGRCPTPIGVKQSVVCNTCKPHCRSFYLETWCSHHSLKNMLKKYILFELILLFAAYWNFFICHHLGNFLGSGKQTEKCLSDSHFYLYPPTFEMICSMDGRSKSRFLTKDV